MSALFFTACTWAEVTLEPIEKQKTKQKPKKTVIEVAHSTLPSMMQKAIDSSLTIS